MLHAMPGVFAGSRLSVQAQPSGRAASDENIGERPTIDVVAGGAVMVRVGSAIGFAPYRVVVATV
jgi:hypothetical protein